MKKTVRLFTAVLTALCTALFGMLIYEDRALPKSVTVSELSAFKVESQIPVSFKATEATATAGTDLLKTHHTGVYRLFGVFPIDSAEVSVSKNKTVEVLGTPFGIKLYTDGVLVVNTTEVKSESGSRNPAAECGIKKGDYLTAVNGTKIKSGEELQARIKDTGGKSLNISYYRGGKDYSTVLTPALSKEDGLYHLGLWVRDSCAGIGTLTFYDPETKAAAGLGHGLCDSDTGKMISVNSGSLVGAEILSVEKSTDGMAGELVGRFSNQSYSAALMNSELGVYACDFSGYKSFGSYEVSHSTEVKVGKAQILTTVKGQAPKLYDCEILSVAAGRKTRNLVVEITDEKLLEISGGVVQGMSGSPIIQNGKLVGAMTHVLVDDPKKGYGIFAQTMLNEAENATKVIKNAS